MKKFILHIIFVVSSSLVFLVFFDCIVSFQLRKSDNVIRNIVWKEIFTEKLESDVVIMGNSRAMVQYNPIILDTMLNINSYNLGFDGRSINSQILRYNTYQRLNVKPKLIIQNIDFATIAKDNAYCREQFFPYFFDKTFRKEVVELEGLTWADEHIPGFRYGGYFHKILSWLGLIEQENSTLTKGYFGNNLKWDGSNISKKTEINYQKDSLSLSAFDNYLAKAYSENIRLIFVYAPIYIRATEMTKDLEGMFQMYDSIAQKYNIPILNYTYDSISYDTAYFYNATHLNKTGAELFTKKLARDIDSLGILK